MAEWPDDYMYRKMWNDKVYHRSFTNDEAEKIFARLAPHLPEEELEMIRKSSWDMFGNPYAGKLLEKIKQHRNSILIRRYTDTAK